MSDGSGDEVDRIVTAWEREVPGLDLGPLGVLSRISRLARHLERHRREAFFGHDLEGWEFDVLSALRRVGDPYELSPGALVQATLSTSGTMTNRLDRLEKRGLLDRRPDPQDRRGVKVRLSEAGRERVDAAMAALLVRERELLAELDTAERDQLADLLRRVLVPLDPADAP